MEVLDTLGSSVSDKFHRDLRKPAVPDSARSARLSDMRPKHMIEMGWEPCRQVGYGPSNCLDALYFARLRGH
jgi:hypothetical protein